MNKSVSDILYAWGSREPSYPTTITSPQKVDEDYLDFLSWAGVYRDRTPRDAAIMILVQHAIHWDKLCSRASNKDYMFFSKICLEAAKNLSVKEWYREENPALKVQELFDNKTISPNV